MFFPTNIETSIGCSGDKSIPGNYMPISLTSSISQVCEHIIRKQVVAFLDRRGLLNDIQHGFRSGRSCLSTMLNVFDNLINLDLKINYTTYGNVPRGYGPYIRPKTHTIHNISVQAHTPLHMIKALVATGWGKQ